MIARPIPISLTVTGTIPPMNGTPPPVDLASATQLSGSDGNFQIELSDRWRLWGPSGGYMSAIALRAAGEISNLTRPVSYYCHFLKSPAFDEVQVEAVFERAGRLSESISITFSQNGEPVLKALVRTAADSTGHTHDDAQIPTSTLPDEIEPFRYSGPGSDEFTYWNQFERRPVLPIARKESLRPISREWVRSLPIASFDDPFLDAARPLMMLDTFGYLAARQKYTDGPLFAPNLDTSAWFHDIGAQTDWLLIEHANPIARDGVMFVDGKVWSEDGVLVASGSAHLLQIKND